MNKKNHNQNKIWTPKNDSNGKFASINKPTAGARFKRKLSKGKHPLQLYSLATPNGIKVTIMLEELIEQGIDDAQYDAWMIDIMNGDQFGDAFTKINPNGKIPALLDNTQKTPVPVFESGSILLYLAEKFHAFIPKDHTKRTQTLNWLFWQMSSAPYIGGGFGHFFVYAPEKLQYPIDRFTMEAKRQLDLLDQHLKEQKYIAAGEYTIADIAIFPWYGRLALKQLYGEDAAIFLDIKQYKHLIDWAEKINQRPAVQRAIRVNNPHLKNGLKERHDKKDFNT